MRNQTTAPAAEPVTLTEAKAHLRVDGTADDTLITALIVAAREQAEAFSRRAFVTQEWELTLDAFPARIEIPLPPLQQVDAITYVDADGATQTLAADQYQVVKSKDAAYIVPAYGVSWPSTRAVPEAVTVAFTCGYPSEGEGEDIDHAANVPASIKAAVLLLVGEMYENREETGPSLVQLPLTAERLLWPYRDLRF